VPELLEPPPLDVPELLEPPPLEVPEELPPPAPVPELWVLDWVGGGVLDVLGALTLPSPVPPVDPDVTEGLPEDVGFDVTGVLVESLTGAVTAAVVVMWMTAG
jgi:hypothetical protein